MLSDWPEAEEPVRRPATTRAISRAAAKAKADFTIEAAADVLALFNSPAMFHHLVRRRGWSLERYQARTGGRTR